MKIKFEFDNDSRSIILTPENDLEKTVINEMASRTEKGSQLKLTKIVREPKVVNDDQGIRYSTNPIDHDFIVELKVNGH